MDNLELRTLLCKTCIFEAHQEITKCTFIDKKCIGNPWIGLLLFILLLSATSIRFIVASRSFFVITLS